VCTSTATNKALLKLPPAPPPPPPSLPLLRSMPLSSQPEALSSPHPRGRPGSWASSLAHTSHLEVSSLSLLEAPLQASSLPAYSRLVLFLAHPFWTKIGSSCNSIFESECAHSFFTLCFMLCSFLALLAFRLSCSTAPRNT
jgi:hypothetical protein